MNCIKFEQLRPEQHAPLVGHPLVRNLGHCGALSRAEGLLPARRYTRQVGYGARRQGKQRKGGPPHILRERGPQPGLVKRLVRLA